MEEKYIMGWGGCVCNVLVLECYWAGKTERERRGGVGHVAQTKVINVSLWLRNLMERNSRGI